MRETVVLNSFLICYKNLSTYIACVTLLVNCKYAYARMENRTFLVVTLFLLSLIATGKSLDEPSDYLSFFVEVTESLNSSCSLDNTFCIWYRFTIMDKKESKNSVEKEFIGRFPNQKIELGWADFVSLHTIVDSRAGFVLGNTIEVVVEVSLLKEHYINGLVEMQERDYPFDLHQDKTEQFIWCINNFTKFMGSLDEKKMVSQSIISGLGLRVVVAVDSEGLGATLESSCKNSFWVSYRFGIVNQKTRKGRFYDAHYKSSEASEDYEWFMPVSEVKDPNVGYLVDDKVVFHFLILEFGVDALVPDPTELLSADPVAKQDPEKVPSEVRHLDPVICSYLGFVIV